MRRTIGIVVALCLAACYGTALADTPRTLEVSGRTVTRATAPARPLDLLAPLYKVATPVDPWTQLGPNFMPGRMLCVGSYILNNPWVACGSDGCGYWSGYALGDAGWAAKGNELGGGVAQMVVRLHFPENAPMVERQTVIRTDGRAFYTDNDGVTWTACTLTPNGDEVYGKVTKLGNDSGSINVAYCLAEILPSDLYPDGGFQFLRSFDGGATFDPTRAWDSRRADMWSSRTGSGQILIAFESFGDVEIELSTDLGDQFESFSTIFDGGAADNLIAITAQEAGAPDHVWVWENGQLQRTTDGGSSFEFVRSTNQLGGPRGLCASILNPDLIVWTTVDGTYFSRDGGETDSLFTTDWPGGGIHRTALNIDCYSWNFGAAAPNYRPRRSSKDPAMAAVAGGSEFERLFISTGAGVWQWQADAVAPTLLTNYNCFSTEWHDFISLRNGHPYDVSGGIRDWGAWAFSDFGPPPGGTYLVGGIVSSENDVSNTATNYRPTAGDPVHWDEFPHGLLVVSGNGVFSAVGVPYTARHNALTADPTSPYTVYSGSDELRRVVYDRNANSFTTTSVYVPVDGAHITAYAISPTNANRRYMADSAGTIRWSANGGTSWNVGVTPPGGGPRPNDWFLPSVTGFGAETDNEQVRITIHPTNPQEAWIAGSTILHTTDGGANWVTATTGLPAGPIRAWKIAYDGTSANAVYLAAGSGPYVLSGSTWFDLALANGSMPAVECRSVEGIPYRGVVRFATFGRGVWDFATGSTVGVAPGGALTLELAPSSNPLRGTGRLEYTLPAQGQVTLELIDVTGRRAAMLLNGVQPAGRGSAFVDASSFRPGVYFAKLTTTQGTRTAKLVVTN